MARNIGKFPKHHAHKDIPPAMRAYLNQLEAALSSQENTIARQRREIEQLKNTQRATNRKLKIQS